MIRKRLPLFLLVFLMAALVKALFFSGNSRTAPETAVFRKSSKAATVWAPAGQHYKRGWLGERLLGQHWRQVWTTPIEAPVFDFSRAFGGVQPGKMGGGMQTTSLSLTSADGRTFVLRSLDKDPVGVLSPFWRHTLVADLVRDQVSAANPYAALVVAPLSEAAGLLHTNPQVVFVSGQDPHIRTHHRRMANRLFLLEEKYNTTAFPQFQSALGIYDSGEMLERVFRRQGHFIDQRLFLRYRLFDIFLGDWDRHEGQWNWVAYATDQDVQYKPIPKDRDQAMSRYQDGLLPWVLTRDFMLPKFGHFDGKLQDIRPYTVNGQFLDDRALNGLQQQDFLHCAQSLQKALTDDKIDAAVRHFPPAIYKLVGAEAAAILKDRRQQLRQAALAFYLHLAKNVVVTGTDEKERFVVQRRQGGKTLVMVFQADPEGAFSRKVYQRVFNRHETESVTLHGLGGNDVFDLSGKADLGIMIKVVGGIGADVIRDESLVQQGYEKKTQVFDTRKGNQILWGPETADKTTDDLSVHNYDREGF